ncbi:unnamed protein product [Urochloa decumbens]|uniref:Leucine-rich repeat-containing N-terminal plant-type domain-containing protein n=1 Tax=Urochloa decumbens TaxID=240449 RepID=A0ABC9BX48_9POAL
MVFKSWRPGTDCCHWEGIRCDNADDRVTSLDLGEQSLESGGLNHAIFDLTSLQYLNLAYNHFNGSQLPSVGFEHLVNLTHLNLSTSSFAGQVPTSISRLTSLVSLDLSTHFEIFDTPDNGFGYTIYTDTSASLIEPNLEGLVANLSNLRDLRLAWVDLSHNGPQWCDALAKFSPMLQVLSLPFCGLSGPICGSLSILNLLSIIDLPLNDLSGPVPESFTNFSNLRVLILRHIGSVWLWLFRTNTLASVELNTTTNNNNLNGIVNLTFFRKFPNLRLLDLSMNNLVVVDGEDNFTLPSLPKLLQLSLSDCNMSVFPNFLRHQNEIKWVDLSRNKIQGAIPQWAWQTWDDLYVLDLSENNFNSIGYNPLLPLAVERFDLHDNMFEGPIPIPQGSAIWLDYSVNIFSSVPSNFCSQLSDVNLFRASQDNLSGKIDSSFCGTSIQLLDLSCNYLNGSVPSCLMEKANGMQLLNLRKNQLHGGLPDNMNERCTLEALDFSGNWIEGQLPRSLAACKNLEVLDVGNNDISDSFPCWMSTLHRLEVLVLKSNKFFGHVAQSLGKEKSTCSFPSAIILDLSSNNFSGLLPQDQWFKDLKSMMFIDSNMPLVIDHELAQFRQTYKYTATVTYKGHDTRFAEILRTLVFIDFSNNAFHGSIPETIWELSLIHGINMSHNFLSGTISSQIGDLNQLEALDLSSNELSGVIPQELASLDFLATLDLSNNKLEGAIPESTHFSTFPNSSFVGNTGLCGPPLSKECINKTDSNVVPYPMKNKYPDIMLFLFTGIGFGVGFSIAIVVAWGIPIRKQSKEGCPHNYV